MIHGIYGCIIFQRSGCRSLMGYRILHIFRDLIEIFERFLKIIVEGLFIGLSRIYRGNFYFRFLTVHFAIILFLGFTNIV